MNRFICCNEPRAGSYNFAIKNQNNKKSVDYAVYGCNYNICKFDSCDPISCNALEKDDESNEFYTTDDEYLIIAKKELMTKGRAYDAVYQININNKKCVGQTCFFQTNLCVFKPSEDKIWYTFGGDHCTMEKKEYLGNLNIHIINME